MLVGHDEAPASCAACFFNPLILGVMRHARWAKYCERSDCVCDGGGRGKGEALARMCARGRCRRGQYESLMVRHMAVWSSGMILA